MANDRGGGRGFVHNGVVAGWDKPASAPPQTPAPPQAPPAAPRAPSRGGAIAGWNSAPPPAPAAPVRRVSSVEDSMHIVISMTSIPARNGTLDPTINSLRSQTRPPDEIRLYLGPGCCIYDSGIDEPPVICKYVKDRGPVTKLSAVVDPAVRSDSIIITVDDDIRFHQEWLETLLQHVQKHPDAAIGMAGWNRKDLIERGRFERAAGECDVIEGFAGVAYRKWFFSQDVLEPPEEIKFVDDVWISAYLNEIGIKRVVVPGAETLIDIKSSDASACGIHTRPDFAALNRRAAIECFSGKPLSLLRLESRKAAQ